MWFILIELMSYQAFASTLGTPNRNPTFNIVSNDGGITTGTGTIEAVCLINLKNYEAEYSLVVVLFAVQSLDI